MLEFLLTFIGSSYNIISSKRTIIHGIFMIKNQNTHAFKLPSQKFIFLVCNHSLGLWQTMRVRFAGCEIAIILVTGNGMFVKIASGIRNYWKLREAGFTMIDERDTGQERKKRRDTGIRPGYFYWNSCYIIYICHNKWQLWSS